MLYDNISLLCKSKNISIHSLEKEAGLGIGSISKWRNNKCSPSHKSLKKIADYFQISVTELLNDSISFDALGSDKIYDISSSVVTMPFVKLPVIDPVSLTICDYIEYPATVIENEELYFAFKATDNSMMPIIIKDDIVVVKKNSSANNGDTVVVVFNGKDSLIRKAVCNNKTIGFLSYNPLFESFIMDWEDTSFEIKGAVVEIRRKL